MEKSENADNNGGLNISQLRKELAAFNKSSRGKSIWQIINSLGPYLLLWVLAYWALQYSFWLALPFMIIASGFQIRLFIIFHDCGHGSFFKSERANSVWGNITGVLTFTPYYYWRKSHARHHATSANLDKRGTGDVWMMTVKEYVEASPFRRLQYRLYRNPLVMFLLGPLLLFLVTNRIASPKASLKEQMSVYGTNLAILLLAVSVSYVIGLKSFLLIQLPISFLGLVLGIWLFYVQHQFEGVYWARDNNWDFMAASLAGGSFYNLPAVLKWFTGNIGYHHIHHLDSRIPNYNLSKCHTQIPAMKSIRPVKLFASLKSLRYRLWDENENRLVGFGHIKRYRMQ